GEYKRQRNINLGGSRRNENSRSNARTVLNTAHEERQKREADRRRQKAASLIQQRWRGARDTGVWRESMRSSLDVSMLSKEPVDLRLIFEALVTFTAYYNGQPQDAGTLHTLLRLLFDNTPTIPARYSRIVAMLSPQVNVHAEPPTLEQVKWAGLISRLLGLALKASASDTASVDADAVLRAILCATTTTATSTASISGRSSGGKIFWSMQRGVLQKLVEANTLYACLSQYIAHADKKSNSAGLNAAVDLAVLPLGVESIQKLAIEHFVQCILTIPGLPSKLGAYGAASITRSRVKWSILADQVQLEMQQRQSAAIRSKQGDSAFGSALSTTTANNKLVLELALTAINTMGNMAAFVLPQLSRQGQATELDSAFIQACAACARAIPSCNLLDLSKSSSKSKTAGERLVVAADAHALKWLSQMLSVQVLELLARASCDSGPSERILQTAAAAQELLLVFVQKWGETASRAVLDNLFQAVDIRTVGWRSVLDDHEFLSAFTGDRVKVETIQSHDLVRLQLLCELLNRQLQTIGDDELFAQGMSLPLPDIKVIARVCRNIAFVLYWSQSIPADLVHLRDIAASLTQQLFIRNSRRPFVEEGFWLVLPALLDMSSFADRVAEDPIFATDNDAATADSDSDISGSDASDADSDTELPPRGAVAAEDTPGVGTDALSSHRLSWLVNTYSGLRHNQRQHIDRSIMTPRLAVLRNIPFVVPFNDRVRLFHALVNRDRERLGLGSLGNGRSTLTHFGALHVARVEIRRASVFEDGFRKLYPVLSGKPIRDFSASGGLEHDTIGARSVSHPGGFGSTDMDVDATGDIDGGSQPFISSGASQPRDLWEPIEPMGSLGNSRFQRSDIFKRRMQIEFVDQHGIPEAGIDGGGVFKEFLTSLVREAFDTRKGMFNATKHNSLYPNPESMHHTGTEERLLMLDMFKFLGAVIGKALYEGILVDVPFALFFLGRCMGYLPTFNDLPTLDEELYRGLVSLKNYPITEKATTDGEAEEDEIYQVFGMDFTVTVSTHDGHTRVVPLVPGGDTIKVTAHNRLLYLGLIAQFKLVRQIDAPTKAFLSGLHSIIPEAWLRLLFATPLELSRLLSGDSEAINIEDWKRNTHYEGAYHAKRGEHPTIVAFWDVVENELTEEQRRKLCKFATSCERPPLLGFAELNPLFCISSSSSDENGNHDHRLPSASTCVNLLKLPVYSSRETLCDKLTTAIESGVGFDLS
ncbi:ubiquitin-protein ligase (E3), partial [Kickxella alabastrina]